MVDSEVGVEALKCEERGELGCRVRKVVVCELCEGEEGDPVVLLIVDINAKVLFENLV